MYQIYHKTQTLHNQNKFINFNQDINSFLIITHLKHTFDICDTIFIHNFIHFKLLYSYNHFNFHFFVKYLNFN